jgi:hypothetical protein
MKLIISLLFFIFSTICVTFHMYEYHKYLCGSNYDYPFQDPTLPTEIRLDNLMSLLTPEEKVIIKFIFTIIFFLFLRLICYGWMEQRQVLFYRS